MHPRNRHQGRYDIPVLLARTPELGVFIRPNPAGEPTIDFADPAAVLMLNRALLRHTYGVDAWSIPPGYLCPPIPGRADYLHHLADLLAESKGGVVPRGPDVHVLDLGTGASVVYPIIGVAEYDWSFVATDVDATALSAAQANVVPNPRLAARVELRMQTSPDAIFKGVIRPGERFAACMCNPPFHASAAAAAAGTRRKVRALHGDQKARQPELNFGGRGHELWCRGGEVGFVRRMIQESVGIPHVCGWFTSLVAHRDSLPELERTLRRANAKTRLIAMDQGQKKSRILAWSFAG